jgi:ketosteroid isomerase-like protein
MPGSNRDIVQRIYDEFNEQLDLPRWALDDEIDWWPPADEPDNGRRHGADAVIEYVREWARSFDDYRCEVEEMTESGDCVAAGCVLRGRVRGSNAELTLPLTQVWRIRGGRVVEVREYRTKAAALAALAAEES